MTKYDEAEIMFIKMLQKAAGMRRIRSSYKKGTLTKEEIRRAVKKVIKDRRDRTDKHYYQS